MIDLHSHVLPKMDDGSSSVQESVRMLRESYRQGVDVMVATSHFYGHKEDPEKFLRRRQEAMERLEEAYDALSMPELLLGAEVAYFRGMSHCAELRDLRIGESKLLLVEMPFSGWTGRVIDDVCSIKGRLGLTPVLAHVERYPDKGDFPKYREALMEAGVYFQCNAEFFQGGLAGMKAMGMMKKNMIHFLGSDCHNMTRRPPNLGEAAKRISKKLGRRVLEEMDEFALDVLGV